MRQGGERPSGARGRQNERANNTTNVMPYVGGCRYVKEEAEAPWRGAQRRVARGISAPRVGWHATHAPHCSRSAQHTHRPAPLEPPLCPMADLSFVNMARRKSACKVGAPRRTPPAQNVGR